MGGGGGGKGRAIKEKEEQGIFVEPYNFYHIHNKKYKTFYISHEYSLVLSKQSFIN